MSVVYAVSVVFITIDGVGYVRLSSSYPDDISSVTAVDSSSSDTINDIIFCPSLSNAV